MTHDESKGRHARNDERTGGSTRTTGREKGHIPRRGPQTETERDGEGHAA